ARPRCEDRRRPTIQWGRNCAPISPATRYRDVILVTGTPTHAAGVSRRRTDDYRDLRVTGTNSAAGGGPPPIFQCSEALAAGPEHATRERPGVFALLQYHLPADADVVHALGALPPARRGGRTVVRDLVLLDANRREVEHHEVGRQPLTDHPAIAQPQNASGLEGEAANRVLERHQLAVAYPLTQDIARLAGGAEVGVQMGA